MMGTDAITDMLAAYDTFARQTAELHGEFSAKLERGEDVQVTELWFKYLMDDLTRRHKERVSAIHARYNVD